MNTKITWITMSFLSVTCAYPRAQTDRYRFTTDKCYEKIFDLTANEIAFTLDPDNKAATPLVQVETNLSYVHMKLKQAKMFPNQFMMCSMPGYDLDDTKAYLNAISSDFAQITPLSWNLTLYQNMTHLHYFISHTPVENDLLKVSSTGELLTLDEIPLFVFVKNTEKNCWNLEHQISSVTSDNSSNPVKQQIGLYIDSRYVKFPVALQKIDNYLKQKTIRP